MSISDNYTPDVTSGNGVTVAFSGNWNTIASTYFRLYWEDKTTGVQTLKTLGTHYTLSFTASGYTATHDALYIPPSTVWVIRARDITKDQTDPYKTSTGFQGNVIENSLDKLTAISQDLQNNDDRTIKFQVGSEATITDPVYGDLPADGYGIVWDGVAGRMRNTASSLAVLEGNAAIVAANITSVNTVATNIANVNTVASAIANVNTVASAIANVNLVGGSIADVNTVAAAIANVNTVATNIANVNTVGAAIANVNTVATNIANVNTVAGISANVTTVAGISANVTTVAGISANVTTVAGISANVTTVAGISADVTSVAANNTNVTTVATNIADVVSAAQAVDSAMKFTFASSTVMADPTTGLLRLNNATPSAVTAIAIDDLSAQTGNPNLSAFIISWDDSSATNKGTLRITKGSAPATFAIYTITGLTDNVGWTELAVTYVTGAGTFSAADNLYLSFTRNGDTGATGAAGSIPMVDAAGTVDAITANYTPDISLSDYQLAGFISTGANTSTTPSFAPDGLTARTITKRGGAALVAGDIGAAGSFHILEYDLANTRWELLNPAKVVEANITLADNTTNNFSTSAHGFTPKGTNVGKFLKDDGTWGYPTESFIIAASDETTNLTTGVAKVTFRMPYAFTLTDVRASVSTVATGGTLLTVDVNDGGTTILSTKLTFDASEKTTTTAATQRVISDSALADDAEITIDIDAVGNTTPGKGLKVYLIGTRA